MQYGLKKDFLNRSSTFDLIKKICNNCDAAKQIVNIFNDLQNNLNSNEKCLKQANEKDSLGNLFSKMFASSNKSVDPETINHFVPLYLSNLNNIKIVWIKISILNKSLIKIIDYIVQNSSKFYYQHALLSNPVEGPLLVSLLAGPCAFGNYTRFKTIDNADPDADELIRRHKMHNNQNSKSHCLPALSPFNPSHDQFQKSNNHSNQIQTAINSQNNMNSNLSLGNLKEFVESLHQNIKSQLVYGKNHVIVNQVN